ncbi:MAG: hypothetical protein ACYDDF_07545 [Thermoplasmatota archaeon]
MLFGLDTGTLLGGAGVIVAFGSLIYTLRQLRVAENSTRFAEEQARAARAQADEAKRVAILTSNAEVSERLRELRARNLRTNPSPPNDLQKLIEIAGGLERYIMFRDTIDTVQDVYFLRKAGAITDEHWRVLMKGQMPTVVHNPGFQEIYRTLLRTNLVSDEFERFFEPIFDGKEVGDPWVPPPGHA